MTTLREIIRVNRTPDEAFAYVADFTTTAEWDSTVRTARKLTDGPVGVGTRFLVNCKLPVGSVDLSYEILEFQPPARLVLGGHSRLFTVEDTITFAPKGEQTDIVYQAAFEFSALLRSGAAIAQPGLQRMGKASVEGLRAALEDGSFREADVILYATGRAPLTADLGLEGPHASRRKEAPQLRPQPSVVRRVHDVQHRSHRLDPGQQMTGRRATRR